MLPFVVFVCFLALDRITGAAAALYPVRVIVVGAVLLLVSRRVLSIRASRPMASALLGIAVFAVWVGPDLLWPTYRSHWLFQNAIMGTTASSVPASTRSDILFILFRTVGCVALVPFVEEIFWRGWLARWLIKPEFEQIPLGTFTTFSFFISALLFASEHGPYWEVGLIAGLAYNWWMMRTRNLADCILAHVVTNACLSAHVLLTSRWEYWL